MVKSRTTASRPKRKSPSSKSPSSAPKRKAAPRAARTRARAAGSRAAPAKAAPDLSRETALAVAHLALEKKAVDLVVLDVRGLSSYADYFVVMTAESTPQLEAIADHLERKMKERGERPIGIEGVRGGRWVLIDFGPVVAHVFEPESREFYDLEGLWADAPRVRVEDPARK